MLRLPRRVEVSSKAPISASLSRVAKRPRARTERARTACSMTTLAGSTRREPEPLGEEEARLILSAALLDTRVSTLDLASGIRARFVGLRDVELVVAERDAARAQPDVRIGPIQCESGSRSPHPSASATALRRLSRVQNAAPSVSATAASRCTSTWPIPLP